MKTEVKVGKIKIGAGNPLVLVAGPCVIESEQSCLEMAKQLKELTDEIGMPFIFKSSYDKANRLSINSFRGPGIKKGLEVLSKVKQKFKLPILSDVHSVSEIEEAKGVLDIIQIPAFLCRQTDIVVEAGKSARTVNIKKGQFMAPWDIQHIIKKVESTGNRSIIITERGYCLGYNNLVTDLRALSIIRDMGYPVIYDATHSVQIPGGKGSSSSGQRQFVSGLSRAAVAFGCDGLFLEVHSSPDKALCDGPNMIDLKELRRLLSTVKKIEEVLE